MTTVSIKEENKKLFVSSPYHPDLPYDAKKIGGRWNGSQWVFDARDRDRVSKLYINIYGSDGEQSSGDLVTLKVAFPDGAKTTRGGIFVGGRCIGRATGRDSGARLSDGIIVLAGNIDSGGSCKNWTTYIHKNSVFEIRDMPRVKAEEVVEIKCDDDGNSLAAEIINNGLNKEALLAERKKLMARIDEINEILSND